MGKLLTKEEWWDILPPFHYLTVDIKTWDSFDYEVAAKWAAHNTEGWVYHVNNAKLKNQRYVFQHSEDMLIFQLWLDEGKPVFVEGSIP